MQVPARVRPLDRLREYRSGKREIAKSESVVSMEGQEIADRLCEPLAEYLGTLSHSRNTDSAYERCLDIFMGWLQDAPRLPLRQVCVRFRDHLEGRGCKPRTVALYLASLRGFFRWASKAYPNRIPNLAEGLRVKVPKSERRSLTEKQVHDLLWSLEHDGSLEGLRDRAIIQVMVSTGLRRAAILDASVEDYTTTLGVKVLRFQPKGKAGREAVMLRPEAVRAVQAWLEARSRVKPYGDTDPLFVSFCKRNHYGRLSPVGLSRIVKARFEGAGIDSKQNTLHTLRHTAATFTAEETRDPFKVRELLGHGSIETSQAYVHSLDRFGPDAPERALDRRLTAIMYPENTQAVPGYDETSVRHYATA